MNSPEPSEAPRAGVVVRQAWLGLLAGGLVLACVPWHFLAPFLIDREALVAYGSLFTCALAALLLFFTSRRIEYGVVRVLGTDVYVGDHRIMPRAALVQAVVYTHRGQLGVRIQGRSRLLPYDLSVKTERDAENVLLALEQGVSQATASFRAIDGGMEAQAKVVLSMLGGLVVLCAMFVFTMIAAHAYNLVSLGSIPVALASAGGLFFALRALRRRQVTLVVGTDGVLATRRGRPAVFYRYSDLEDVRPDGGDLVFTLKSEETVRFGMVGLQEDEGPDGEIARSALLARIAQARAVHTSLASTSHVASVLARGDRQVSTWRASLTSLLGAAATYRTPAVPPETLWRVLEDPTQPETARAGAAVALRATLDDEARVRLRVATASCASAELRGTFEAALEEWRDTTEEHARIDRALGAFRREAR